MNFLKKLFLKEIQRREREEHYLKNGGHLLEDIISHFGPRYAIPIRHFSAQEILRATNGFRDPVEISNPIEPVCLGSLERGSILVKKSRLSTSYLPVDEVIRDIAITSQMSHHKNVLKLVGCCLEFEQPALIYEFCEGELLYDKLFDESNPNRSPLSWRSRIRIANDIANAITYLHNAFPTPILFRHLTLRKVIIDKDGIAKLFDFSSSISIPLGEEQVEGDRSSWGTGYMAPEYAINFISSQKTDVYSFGMFLMQLLLRKRVSSFYENLPDHLMLNLLEYLNSNELDKIVDPKLLEDGTMQQIQAFLHLSLKCLSPEKEDRPFMIDVAKELQRIERYPHQLPPLALDQLKMLHIMKCHHRLKSFGVFLIGNIILDRGSKKLLDEISATIDNSSEYHSKNSLGTKVTHWNFIPCTKSSN